jgi:hypothetical protein
MDWWVTLGYTLRLITKLFESVTRRQRRVPGGVSRWRLNAGLFGKMELLQDKCGVV